MTSRVEKSIEVDVPLQRAYNQWTQFEQFPQFMAGVEQVKQLNDTMLHWVAKIAGVKREWDARILEQVPDRKVAWAATTGTTNGGSVYFEPLGPNRTGVRLVLEYDPEGFTEKVGDWLNIVSRQAQSDLEKFKEFIESRGAETGAWRGAVSGGSAAGDTPAGAGAGVGGAVRSGAQQPESAAGGSTDATPGATTGSPGTSSGEGGDPSRGSSLPPPGPTA
jgi:carbon monoxide dehydrogenase subunit G